jgi:preprotein translocase subunit SecA
MDWLRKIFDTNEREVARYRDKVGAINDFEPKIEKLSNAQLRARTEELKEIVQSGWKANLEKLEQEGISDFERKDKTRKALDDVLDEILPEAFAIVREASKRTLGQRHYDVQLIGGMVTHDGRIAELRTGEGKTLMATLPLYLNALAGRGAHLVTANDYLSKVGAVWMGPIYHLLGMSVGIIQGQSPETGDEGGSYIYDPDYDDGDPRYTYCRTISRKEAYDCDVTYGTNNEFGFDYLRDNMAFSADELVQRGLHFAIVDEVDSILIDEARTPLIISGMVEQDTRLYAKVDRVVRQLRTGIDVKTQEERDDPNSDRNNPDIDYLVDEKQKTVAPTDAGVQRLERMLGIRNLADDPEMMHYVTAAMKAHALFKKDIDYVIKDGEIIIVDEFTGRLMFGRRYSDGLHQAIEAKENVEIKNESQTLATITFQNLFRLYLKLAGMTGTAKTEEDEFRKIYSLDVVVVPTNRPMIRKDQPDVIYKVAEHKFRGIAWEILRLWSKQQPVLVGTRSIEMSEKVSERITSVSLQILSMVNLIRNKMENSKGLDKAKLEKWTELLNGELDRLSVNRLAPIAKELGLPVDPLSEEALHTIATLLPANTDDECLNNIDEALRHGIPHNILNAKYHEKEALIISEAGRKGAITIATNMAGRGVDILLGGKPHDLELPPEPATAPPDSSENPDKDGSEEDNEPAELSYRRGGKHSVLDTVTSLTPEEHAKAAEEVRSLGGLYILGTERHESRRIDNQLRGRSGRQGDPGESRFFVSLEDDLWRLFGDRSNHPLLRTWPEDQSMDAPILSKMIQKAQKRVEESHFESRKQVLQYDDVMNKQREVIYSERHRILEGANLRDTVTDFLEQIVSEAVEMFCPESAAQSNWEITELYNGLDEYFPLSQMADMKSLLNKNKTELRDYLTELILKAYEQKEAEITAAVGEPDAMREIERSVALQAINRKWMEHLAAMDYLRENIYLRGYAQQDPLIVYQKEAFEMFETMQHSIQDDITRYLFRIQLMPPKPQKKQYTQWEEISEPVAAQTSGSPASGTQPKRAPGRKPGRNEPCWCGSGKKYKACHYPD